MRTNGILMHLTSLPSPYGIGTMGADARAFVDFLEAAGQSYWQILPICPTGFGDSPYQTFSSFAGNPYLIDLEDLHSERLLNRSEFENQVWGSSPLSVDYGILYRQRYPILRSACQRFSEPHLREYHSFCKHHSFWLEDYATFMALKDAHDGAPWQQWKKPLRNRDPEALALARDQLKEEIEFWKRIQYLFFSQWRTLKACANAQGIQMIGDLPIYVANDSAEVWSHPEQFQLDENRLPIEVAGCPPDGFSAKGQLWGNPLFDWDYMEETGFEWWIRRIDYQFGIYDVLRIDHFRGFDSYYAIPYGAPDAKIGRWRKGPGIKLFQAVEQAIGKKQIIAEDLGFLTPSVHALREATGFPGMKVLQFAFDRRDRGGSLYLPHNYPQHCVVYVGTHDNDTALGWVRTAPPEDVTYAVDYLRLHDPDGAHWGMMRSIWASVGDWTIIQMQDILGLGSEARMNTPSTVGNNWKWRAAPGFATSELASKLWYEMDLYDRLPANRKRI